MKSLASRLESLERRSAEAENEAIVAQLSALMDELSARAVGDESPKRTESLAEALDAEWPCLDR